MRFVWTVFRLLSSFTCPSRSWLGTSARGCTCPSSRRTLSKTSLCLRCPLPDGHLGYSLSADVRYRCAHLQWYRAFLTIIQGKLSAELLHRWRWTRKGLASCRWITSSRRARQLRGRSSRTCNRGGAGCWRFRARKEDFEVRSLVSWMIRLHPRRCS